MPRGLREISIHALRKEGDGFSYKTVAFNWVFLSTPSARRATARTAALLLALAFLSTPSARRATREQVLLDGIEVISIHALRKEGDLNAAVECELHTSFLSTPSARRATYDGYIEWFRK